MPVLDFGSKLRETRLGHDLALSHFALITGINVVELSRVEGRRLIPSKEFMTQVRIKGRFDEEELQQLDKLLEQVILKPPMTREEAIQKLPVFVPSNFEVTDESFEKLVTFIMEND